MFDTILNVNKPAGLTSARVVSRIKRLLPPGTKVGHAGTLDPFATGVLLILVGKATRRCEELMGLPKQYLAELKLGYTTATDDPESPEIPTPAAAEISEDALRSVLPRFIGTIEQIPPAYSALKIGGRRASDRVRKGQAVNLKPRPVRIDALELLEYRWPLARIRVDCGRGTYIRALARDIGQALGVGAYLTALQRTRVGEYRIEEAIDVSDFAQRIKQDDTI